MWLKGRIFCGCSRAHVIKADDNLNVIVENEGDEQNVCDGMRLCKPRSLCLKVWVFLEAKACFIRTAKPGRFTGAVNDCESFAGGGGVKRALGRVKEGGEVCNARFVVSRGPPSRRGRHKGPGLAEGGCVHRGARINSPDLCALPLEADGEEAHDGLADLAHGARGLGLLGEPGLELRGAGEGEMELELVVLRDEADDGLGGVFQNFGLGARVEARRGRGEGVQQGLEAGIDLVPGLLGVGAVGLAALEAGLRGEGAVRARGRGRLHGGAGAVFVDVGAGGLSDAGGCGGEREGGVEGGGLLRLALEGLVGGGVLLLLGG